MSTNRIERYRRLTERFGGDTVRALIDRLQVLALTQPEVLREIEEFLDRGQLPAERHAPTPPPESSVER